MRWLPNISLSSSSSSPPSTSSRTDDCDSPALDLRKGNSCENQHQRRDRRIGVGGPMLTRARKLRHLTDNDLATLSSLRSHASDPSDFAALSLSASSFDHASTSRCSSVVAVPLPLPLPEGKSELAEGEGRLRSTKEVGNGRGMEERERDGVRDRDRGKERDIMDGAGEGMLSNSPIAR